MDLDLLYGNKSNPYYIYAPRYIEASAGIKALHYLCHSINRMGMQAYLVFSEDRFAGEPRVSSQVFTPILTQEIAESHFQSGLNPIAIYSETVPGNPLKAKSVIRYLLNYVGALGGPEDFERNEIVVSFSKNIAQHYFERSGVESPILFLPPIDPREFKKTTQKSNYQVVYAGKYRSFIGEPPKIGKLPTVEIFRDGPRMQSRGKVKELLQDAQIVASFENSSILIEAILSGTPALFVENPFLGKPIAEHELGKDGIAIDFSDEAIKAAHSSNDAAILNYFNSIQLYFESLQRVLSFSQNAARSEKYDQIIQIPNFHHVISSHRVGLGLQILKSKGMRAFMRVIFHFFLRRLTWRLKKTTE